MQIRDTFRSEFPSFVYFIALPPVLNQFILPQLPTFSPVTKYS